jgi:fructose-1,6-bisphosphatase/inositol monophosphatase family enzyme
MTSRPARADELLDLFTTICDGIAVALVPLAGETRRARTDKAGQYHLDTVADAVALPLLHAAGVAVVSEESGRSGPPGAGVTVVIDPVDGSTNCSRGLPYWATSLCAVDGDGPLCSLVRNHATGVATTAVRGAGAWRDGAPIRPATVTSVTRAVVALDGLPERTLPWRQFRALGSQALALCDLAAGVIEGYVAVAETYPWDYLGAWLACTEAGAPIVDAADLPLAVTDPEARRRIVAASTPELLAELRTIV